METLLQTTHTNPDETIEQADLLAITELSAHDLALVGGGCANLSWL